MDKRTHLLGVRLSRKEQLAVEQICNALGISRSTYIRRLIKEDLSL